MPDVKKVVFYFKTRSYKANIFCYAYHLVPVFYQRTECV